MSFTIYSPKSTGKGCMSAWSVNSKDESIWCKLIAQTGTDSANGSFKGGAAINLKFNYAEVGDLIRAVQNVVKVSFFHKAGDTQTSITFSPYTIAAVGDKPERTGFGLNVKQGNLEYKLGVSNGSAYALVEYLKFALGHCFSANYSADKKAYEEAQKAKAAAPAPKAKAQEAPPEDGNEEDGADF